MTGYVLSVALERTCLNLWTNERIKLWPVSIPATNFLAKPSS